MARAVVNSRDTIENIGLDGFACRSQIQVNASIGPAEHHGHYAVLKAFAD